MEWLLAIGLKPWLLAAFFAFVVAVELALRRVIPNSRVKLLLFDRTFIKRRPMLFMAVWAVLMIALWWWIAATYFTPELGFY